MNDRRSAALILAAALAVGGCPAPGGPGSRTEASRPSATSAVGSEAALVRLTGKVKAPAAAISNNGASIVANNGAALISDRGAAYALRGLDEASLAGVEVFVADAAGNPFPGIPAVRTGADGRYELAGIRPGFTYAVVARVVARDGRPGTLQTLVRPDARGATADLTVASTFVTAAVVDGLQADMGNFNLATFGRATAETGSRLEADELPSLADQAAIRAFMRDLSKRFEALREDLDALRSELRALEARVDALERGASAAPAPAGAPSTPPPVVDAAAPPSVGSTPPAASAAPPTSAPGLPTASPSAALGPAAPLRIPVGLDPLALAIDAAGNVYVGNSNGATITKVDPDGKVLATWPAPGGMTAFELDAAGDLWMTCAYDGTVRKFGMNGVEKAKVQVGGAPHDLDFDPAGNAWVALPETKQVKVLAPDLRVLATHDVSSSPRFVRVAPSGDVWLGHDPWDEPGAFQGLSRLGADGVKEAEFPSASGLRGMALGADGAVWASAHGGKSFRVSSAGDILSTYEPPCCAGRMTMDALGHAWVAVGYTTQIERYAPDGRKVDGRDVGGEPANVAVDARGRIWVAVRGAQPEGGERQNGELVRLDP